MPASPPLLPRVLADVDLPLAEMHSARLDGELYGVADGFVPVDMPDTPTVRACAALVGLASGAIVERLSAAWIWGAIPHAPTPTQICVQSGGRRRPGRAGSARAREVLITADEMARLAGARVTVPMRTVIDLARFPGPNGALDLLAIRNLMTGGEVTLETVRDYLAQRPRLPGKRSVLPRIHQAIDAAADQPELTRYTS